MSIRADDLGVDAVPLVVDLDRALVRSDLTVETLSAYLAADPLRIADLFKFFFHDSAASKARIANEAVIDPAHLPYDERVLAIVGDARSAGRPVYLVSSNNERCAAAIARHLSLFDGWFASTDDMNLASSDKARRLVEAFGKKAFDYIGNAPADDAIWTAARSCVAVHPTAALRNFLRKQDPDATIIDPPDGRARAWVRLARVHQWAKNSLVLVPLLTSHRFDIASIFSSLSAFVAFSLAASAVYVVNDIVDIEADRKHPSKRRRPLAAGTVPILQAFVFAILLFAVAIVVALGVSRAFALVLAAYLVLTTAYTFVLKRKMIVDILTLATLYTLRVIGGAAAISVPTSEWLLAFSMFIFTALALLKRYVELAGRVDADLPDMANRDYRNSDLDIIAMLACAAAFNAVTVFALYISSDAVRLLYRHPRMLWLVCPVLMYWLARAILTAHRRLMDDDPIIFALRDRDSLLSLGLIGVIMIAAI